MSCWWLKHRQGSYKMLPKSELVALAISVLGFYRTLALGFFCLAFMIRNELYNYLPFSYMSLPLSFYPKQHRNRNYFSQYCPTMPFSWTYFHPTQQAVTTLLIDSICRSASGQCQDVRNGRHFPKHGLSGLVGVCRDDFLCTKTHLCLRSR